jgi:hypothetical protein
MRTRSGKTACQAARTTPDDDEARPDDPLLSALSTKPPDRAAGDASEGRTLAARTTQARNPANMAPPRPAAPRSANAAADRRRAQGEPAGGP